MVPEEVGRGPLNLTLPLPPGGLRRYFSESRVGQKVEVTNRELRIGRTHLVDYSEAERYSPGLGLTKAIIGTAEIGANCETAVRTTLIFGNPAGLGQLLSVIGKRTGVLSSTGNLNVFARAALPGINRIVQALDSGERHEARLAVRQLIGLGPGLTPSADDTLAGLMLMLGIYSANAPEKLSEAQLLSEAILSEVAGRTTRLSEEFLRQAAWMRGNEPVVRLCSAILTEGRDSVAETTRDLLRVGETSGTDTVLGVVLGAIICSDGLRTGTPSEAAHR